MNIIRQIGVRRFHPRHETLNLDIGPKLRMPDHYVGVDLVDPANVTVTGYAPLAQKRAEQAKALDVARRQA